MEDFEGKTFKVSFEQVMKKNLHFCEEKKCCFLGKREEKDAIEDFYDIDLEECHYAPSLSVLVTMFYMIIANIIMLNILIAMFNYRYEVVQQKSVKLSAYFRYIFAFLVYVVTIFT